MKKITVNTHEDFLGTDDAEFVAAYKKRAEDILTAEWDVVEFVNVKASHSWEYEIKDEDDDRIDDNFASWTQESIERAYQEAS